MKNQDVFIFTSQNYGRKKTDGIRILQWNVYIFLFFQASFNYHNLAAQAHHGSSNNNGLFNECSMTAAAAANYYYNTASNWNTPASDYKIIWTFTTSTHSAAFCFKVCPILFLEVHTSYFLSDQLNILSMKPKYYQKLARNGHEMAIYLVRFISDQSLLPNSWFLTCKVTSYSSRNKTPDQTYF